MAVCSVTGADRSGSRKSGGVIGSKIRGNGKKVHSIQMKRPFPLDAK